MSWRCKAVSLGHLCRNQKFVEINAWSVACRVVWRCRPNLARPSSGTDVTGRARKGLAQSIGNVGARGAESIFDLVVT